MPKRYDRMDTERRLNFIQALTLLTLALLTAGLAFFQLIKGDNYVSLASQNRLRIMKIMPPRGVISDRNGAPLAVNVRTFNINCYPVDLMKEENSVKIVALLNRNGIPMDGEQLKGLVEKQYSAPYRAITVAQNLTLAQVSALIMDRDFKDALFLSQVWRRTYPAGAFTAHVIGYVGEITKEELEPRRGDGYRGGDIIGKNGVEAWYETTLRGQAGEEVIEVDSRGRKLRDITYRESRRGGDMTLTIDLTAQRYAAELMGGYRGAIIAMDVTDGSIVTLYSSPSYDTNPLTWGISSKEWAELTDRKERPMMNRAVSGAYPPASTFKIVTASAVLEGGAATTATIVNCPGYIELGGRRFRCWQRHGHGNENVVTALRDSCDVFFYQTALRLGIGKLITTASKFGVGEKTGIDLPGEISGTLAGPAWKKNRVKENWYGGDTVNYSIGQGYLLMTPLQVLCAYASVANGGKLYRPKLYAGKKPEYSQLEISPAIISILQRGFLEVTGSGTGRRASQFGVHVAGKTGTAQNAHGDDHAWFAGYAPATKPRYAVVVIAEAGRGGAAVAGPMAGKMLSFLVNGVKYVNAVPPVKTP